MIDTITIIQEITLQAKELGLYEYLFVERNLSRDEALNLLEMWGKEFERNHEGFAWDGSVSYYDEIDKFVQTRLGELKCEDIFKSDAVIGSVIRFAERLYKVKGANGVGLVVEPIGPKGNTWSYYTQIGYASKDKIKFIRNYPDVMDTTNGHDPELVGKINRAWSEKREQFCPILRALYDRDIKEIMDSDAWDWTDDVESVKETLHDDWDVHADNYLMHIADDWDLKAILYFLRYEA